MRPFISLPLLASLAACGPDSDDPTPQRDASTLDASPDASLDASRSDASIDATLPPDAGSDAANDRPLSDGGVTLIWQGTDPHPSMEVFARGDRAWVLSGPQVRQFRLPDGRAIGALGGTGFNPGAAFDGQRIAHVVGGELRVLDAEELSWTTRADFDAHCSEFAFVRDRLICLRIDPGNRGLEAYDVAAGTLVAGLPYNGAGSALRAVPGTDAFVLAVDGPAFMLFRLNTGTLYAHEPETFPGAGVRAQVYTFDDAQPPHLVTDRGALLRVDVSCANGCFVADGDLGLLNTDERFLALDRDEHVLAGLVGPRDLGATFDTRLLTFDLQGRRKLSERKLRSFADPQLDYSHGAKRAIITTLEEKSSNAPRMFEHTVLSYELH